MLGPPKLLLAYKRKRLPTALAIMSGGFITGRGYSVFGILIELPSLFRLGDGAHFIRGLTIT